MDRNRLPFKQGMLERIRIRDLLVSGLDYPLVTVIAGPGYGKTQAVAQCVRCIRQRVIWLNLTQLDNNSEHFWNTLVSSIGHELPDFAAALRGHAFPGTIREFDRHLIEAAGALEFVEDTVFVIDNFSVITEGPVRLFIETLIRVQLARLCVFLISTRPADQGFAESLVGRDYLEITSDALRFTGEEAGLLFKNSGVEISGTALSRVMEETEGWPLAVYLLSRQYAKAGTCPRAGQAPAARLPALDRLFDTGFFAAYPLWLQKLLVCFSFLPAFAPEMAGNLGADKRGQLAAAAAGNVFISYDYNSGTHIIHPMYQDFLRRKRPLITEAELSALYQSAGDWFHRNDRPLEAMECYHNCASYADMVASVLMLPVFRRDAATANHLLSHLEQLPASFMDAHPEVHFCIAVLYLNRMEVRKAKGLLLSMKAQLESLPQDAEGFQLLGEVYAMLANIYFLICDNACFDYYAKAAEILERGGGSRFHSRAISHIGNNNTLFIQGAAPGLLRQTVERVLNTTQYTDCYMQGQGRGTAHLFAAEAAYATFNIAPAKEYCNQSIFLAAKEDQHDIVCNAYFLQLRFAVLEGDGAGVLQMLQTLADYCEQHGTDVLGELQDNARGWLYIRLGLMDKVPRWIAKYDNDRYLQSPLAMGRNKIVYAHYLVANQRYRECSAYLDGMEWLYQEKGLWTIRLHHHIIKAICLANTGAIKEAVARLHTAYEMTHANGIIMCFVEYGERMRALAELAEKQTKRRFSPTWLRSIKEKATLYAESVLSAKRGHLSGDKSGHARVRLSKREHEVLCLMVGGKTRGEIAAQLGISVNSVKTHMAGAYSKLGAANKADAIRLAIGLGLAQDTPGA